MLLGYSLYAHLSLGVLTQRFRHPESIAIEHIG